jgi:acyl-coenzyme A thioesterase PaaI-like protein
MVISKNDMHAAGWECLTDNPFSLLVGPIWQRHTGADFEFAIATCERHGNRRGVVHGGAITTLADHAMGVGARLICGDRALSTVNLEVQFLAAGRVRELLHTVPRVMRTTRSLIFMRCDIFSADTLTACAAAIMKRPAPAV